MKMQCVISRISKVAVYSVLLLAVSQAAHAATVRGRLDRIVNGRRVPAVGIAVTVSASGRRSAPAYTKQDGIYYLQNVPPGTYNLEIWISRVQGARPLVYVISVHEPLTDIPALRL